MAINLDKKDWRILHELTGNARQSHSQIARKVGLSKNAVTYRIEGLKKKGVIARFFTIIEHELLGYGFYEVLIKFNYKKDDEKKVIDYLQKYPNTMVIDQTSGGWDFVVEYGTKNVQEFYGCLNDLKDKMSSYLDTFETHIILNPLVVEQLPVNVYKKMGVEKKRKPFLQSGTREKVDELDKKLLFELDKDSTAPLYVLAERLKVTSETVASRIKKLVKKKIIVKFTAQVNLRVLGYDVAIVKIDLRNLTKEKEKLLVSYIKHHSQVRYSFLGGTRPEIFVYLAVERASEVDDFLREAKEKFFDVIVNQSYLWSTKMWKYNLFPEGMI
ncbi:Lrp/AsnC family transcriptional regulator [Candidatus Woesearchaeota archaeon]|nr:Lrp/AsnC family transcriptional regulator [Candidatus Woesearchaeota archaeon]